MKSVRSRGSFVALRIGAAAVRANLVPMILLWTVSAALVCGYYSVPAVVNCLRPLAHWQTESGWVAAFVSRFLFCGLATAPFMRWVGDIRSSWSVIIMQAIWAGVCGILSDWMFSLNEVWFGAGVDLKTLCLKTAVCQFVWTPVLFMPLGTVVYLWLGRDLSLSRLKAEWPPHLFRDFFCPNLLSSWVVWIPTTMLMTMFPTALQIQLSGFVGVFHALLLLSIGRNRSR